MDVTLPDGTTIAGVPDGTTKEQLLGRLQLAKHPAAEGLMKEMASKQALADTSGIGKFNAGMGLAFTNIGRAGKQMLGLGSEYDDNKGSDRALMNTGAGVAGNVSGNIAAFAPLALVPGANTVAGAAAIGGITGAFQPTDNTKERLRNMLIGTGVGAATQYAGTTGAQKLGEFGAAREAAVAAKESRNAVRDETLKRAQEAGYVIPASVVNPSMTNRVVESIAGKAAVGQGASLENQQVTDRLARSAAGLTEDQAIAKPALRAARYEAAQPYREIAALNEKAAADLEALQAARNESKLQWKSYGRSANPEAFKAAQVADTQVAKLQDSLEQAAKSAGKDDLVEAMKQARVRLAQNHEVQRALNVGSGSVDASSIGRSLDRGSPLTGDLETIGRFQQAFSPYAREGSSIPTPHVSKVAALASALMAGGGHAVEGPLGATIGASIPFTVPPAAKALALSKSFQKRMARPDYSVGALTRGAAALDDPKTRAQAALLARALALPTVPMVNQ